VTARRQGGGSVVRSRGKRGIRAAFRAERDALPRGADVVVIARRGAEALGSEEVAAELAVLFRAGAAR
jgi:ribonuclease P protein component